MVRETQPAVKKSRSRPTSWRAQVPDGRLRQAGFAGKVAEWHVKFAQAFGDGTVNRHPIPALERILCQRNSSARSASAHRLADPLLPVAGHAAF